MQIPEALQYSFLDNPLGVWLVAAALVLVTGTVLPLLKHRYSKIARRMDRQGSGLALILRLIDGVRPVFTWAVALYVVERLLNLPAPLERVSTVIILCVVWIQVGVWSLILFDHFIEKQRARRGVMDAGFASSIAVIRFIALVVIWSLVVLLALDNVGVDVTALVASVGIGGIAVALAVQALLKDLLGSVAIALDRPFVVGDSITIGPMSGTVEHIGIKSTQLRSTSGEQINLSNADLVQARIRNFGRMEERRSLIAFSIAYETPVSRVRRISEIVENVVRAQPGMRFERCHFRDFGARGLSFEAVFFAIDANMDALLGAQQAINLALKEALQRAGIALAYSAQRAEHAAVAAPVSSLS